jgi:hypothetical protein
LKKSGDDEGKMRRKIGGELVAGKGEAQIEVGKG